MRFLAVSFFLLFLSLSVISVSGTVIKDDFSTDSGLWTYYGNASRDAANGYVVLTENNTYQVGVIWLKQNITTPFTVKFRFKMGGGSGADGMVFMFYKDKNYVPAPGNSLGFNSAVGSVSGYGVEFDSYPYNEPDVGNNDHIAIVKDSVYNHLVFLPEAQEPGITDDFQWHNVTVNVFKTGIEVYVDNQPYLTWNGAIERSFSGLGFSASTGALTNWHIIDDIEILTPSKPKPKAKPFMIESKYFRAEQTGLRKRIPVNETAEFSLKLKNLDDEPMKIKISAIQSQSTPGDLSINTTPEITLNPLEETTVPVKITPHEKGSYIVTVTVTCPDAPYNKYEFVFVVDAY